MNLILHKINAFIRYLKYGEKANSEVFIKSLRKSGAKIGEGTVFFSPASCLIDPVRREWIRIGDWCKITNGFTMLAHDYSTSVLIHTHHSALFRGGAYTTIGNNCFIGTNVTMLMGTHIGDNVIVGSCSVITKDLPSNTVCVGNPAHPIASLEQFFERRNEKYLDDVKRNVRHFYEKNKHMPTGKELGLTAFVYLDRTESNWKKYFGNMTPKGYDIEELRKSFNSTPIFETIDALYQFALEE